MTSLLGWTFFGLTPAYRASLFSQIHEIVFFGNGGYTWPDVYNMPIWLRKFTFKSIQEHMKKVSEASNKAQPKKSLPKGPSIQPSFTSKSSKK